MRDSVRKEQRYTMLMRMAACVAVLFATMVAAKGPGGIGSGHKLLPEMEKTNRLKACELADREDNDAIIDQVRSEAMLRAKQEYGDDK